MDVHRAMIWLAILRHRFDHPFKSRKDVSKGHRLHGKDVEDHEEDIQCELQDGSRTGGSEGAKDTLTGCRKAQT